MVPYRPRNGGAFIPLRSAAVCFGADAADRALVLRVVEALVLDSAVRGRRVEVSARDGAVVLSGEIDSAEAGRAAERCARATPGVTAVANCLVVTTAWHWDPPRSI